MAGDEEGAAGGPAASSFSPQERPWLLPYNRKLRHLQGITIRNLTLTPPPGRPRGKTIDDEAVPSTLKSPTKALAQRESKILAHSRSSSDLKTTETVARTDGSPKKSTRSTIPKVPRRRSTLEWSGASLVERQHTLQDVISRRMVDAFFSLHVEDVEEPIHISEVVPRTMNPNFRFFDLGPCGPGVTRRDAMTVKVWARNEHMANWQYVIEFNVQLRALQFIGKSLDGFDHPLPPNCILFHMTDGIYTSLMDFPVGEKIPFVPVAPPRQQADGRVLMTSSYDALMRLSTLDDCIQDALATQGRLAEEIESILKENKEAISAVNQVPEAKERLRTVENAVAAEKRRVEAVRRKRDELKSNIQFRKDAIQKGQELQAQVEEGMESRKEEIKKTKEAIKTTSTEIRGQRRRICEDLQKIYPIEPIPGKSLAFTIRGLALPNAEFDDAKDDVVSAALGYVAQVVQLLSPYMSVIIPYPVEPKGSTSTIEDPLSMTPNAPRTYPLFMKGVVRYRFEYGVFLLNKNIEILANSLGLRLLDIRQTLPNLKYLLFVATAGDGELPARKAGGIKGLLWQEGALSRKGSIDSAASSVGDAKYAEEVKSGLKKPASGVSNGKPISAVQALQRSSGLAGSRLREIG